MSLRDEFSPTSLLQKGETRLSALTKGKLASLFNVHAEPVFQNGLRLKYESNPRSDSIAMEIHVNAGARHDPPGKEGLAHMLEHMILSQNKSVLRDIQQEIIKRGGATNDALTSDCYTIYNFRLPRTAENEEFLYKAAARMVFKPEFDPAQLEEEKKVVIGEYKLARDRGLNDIQSKLFATAFGRGPDHIMGNEKSIISITVDDLNKFHDDHYGTSNVIMNIEGVPLFSQTWAMLRKNFSDLPAGKQMPEPPFKYGYKGGHDHMTGDTEIAYAQAAFLLGHDMTPKETAVKNCLCDYVSHILMDRIRGAEGRMGYNADSRSSSIDRMMTLELKTEVLPEYKEAAMQAMAETVADVAQGKIDQDVFSAIKRGELQFQRDAEHRMAVDYYTPGHREPDKTIGFVRSSRKLLNEVTPDDMIAMMKKGLEQPPTLVTRGQAETPGTYASFCSILGVQPAQNRSQAAIHSPDSRPQPQGQALQS